MESSDKPEILPPAPTYSHRPLFHHHHHHHHHLELSPHCPQHAAYLLRPNSHHHHHHHTAATAAAHHHLEVSPNCPLHRHLLPHCPLHSSNFHSNNQSTTSFPIIPNFSSIPLQRNPNFCNPNVNILNSVPPEADANSKSEDMVMQNGNEEDEGEEEFIFVLTDEWKEFFAKSEAKRRLAKKQAKRKGKD